MQGRTEGSEGALSVGDWLLVAAALVLLVPKLLFTFWAFPIADEAYYWMWGQHPALSYFDHPPLQAWLQGASHLVFGRSLFALRWMSVAAFFGIAWVIFDVAKRLGGAGWRRLFLKGLVIYLAAPLFGFFGSVVFNDYLLVFLLVVSGYFFVRFLADVETLGDGRLTHLFAGAVLLGLAGLTKYNAVFLGIAVAGAVLIRPRLRPLLRRWELYLAAAIAIGMQAPVLIWAIETDFASFRFHLSERFEGSFHGLSVARMRSPVLNTAAYLSPFLVPVIVRFFWARSPVAFERVGKTLAIWVFWLSSLTFLYISNYSTVLVWWNIAAFALVIPFASRYMGPWLLTLHVLWGTLVSIFLAVSFTYLPLTSLVGQRPFNETDRAFGWAEIATAMRAAEAAHGADFLAANRYQLASQLGFALDRGDIETLSRRRDAFDDWLDPEARRGQDAIILVEDVDDTESFRAAFETVSKLDEIKIEQFGYPMNTYSLYFGDNFVPPDPFPEAIR